MGQNTNKKRPLVWAHDSTREVILLWMDSFNIDADNEAVDCLVRRIHAATFPFDADAPTLLDALIEAIHWQADRIDGDREAANLLLYAAEQVSNAFAEARLIDGPRRVGATGQEVTGNGRSSGAEPEQCDGRNAEEESTTTPDEAPQPMRRDLIHAAVEVRLADGSRGVVAHPPFFGRVRMTPKDGRPRIVPVDDLCQRSQRALRSARVRRRVEVHARCTFPQGCTRKLPAFLAEDQRVEDAEGNTVCGFADLFYGRCPQHLRNE